MPQGSEQADRAIERLQAVLASLERDIQRLLMRLDTERGTSTLVADEAALASAARVRTQITQAITAAGGQVRSILDESAVAAARAVASDVGLGAFTPDLASRIQSIVSAQTDDLATAFGDAQQSVARAVRVALASTADLPALIEDVAGTIRKSAAQARALVDSTVMAVGRTTTTEQAEQAATETGSTILYVYDGPRDSITRKFCAQHLGQAFSLAALDRLDNGTGQPKPVSAFLGGYNCRHRLAPIDRDMAVAEGLVIHE